jgi:hypothetical protein
VSDVSDHDVTSGTGAGMSVAGEWVVTLDVESRTATIDTELSVRALAIAVAGGRTYVAARPAGYSFTVIIGSSGADTALLSGMRLLAAAQGRAGLPVTPVVCAEVTLVGARSVPAASGAQTGCQNPAS